MTPLREIPSVFLDETYDEKLEEWSYCMVKIVLS